ncbi:MAG: hypothetical protein JXR03_20490 [Cyclobacteriaceae bacterium]
MRKLVVIVFAVLMGCNEILECELDPNVEYAVVGFYNSADSTEKEVKFNLVSNSQFAYYDALDSGVFFPLPLDPSQESITYLFETDSDTYNLTLSYELQAVQLYSLDCGGSFGFDSLKAFTTAFDSTAVIGPTINKNILVNVEVYF